MVKRPSARWVSRVSRVRRVRPVPRVSSMLTPIVLAAATPGAGGAQPATDACCVPPRAGVSTPAAHAVVAPALPTLLRGRGTARVGNESSATGTASHGSPTRADSLRVVRPMSGAERAVVALAATLSGVSWGLGGAVAGGAVGIGSCLARRSGEALDRVRECRAAEWWLAGGGMLGTLAGAANGANFAARRLGCGPGESRRRAWGGAALGTLVAAAPTVAYLADDDPSVLLGAALVLVVPTLQIGGAARQAGRCGLPVILR